MQIVFFEVQPWEHDLLLASFPGCKVTSDKLDTTTVQQFTHAQVVSCFIYSRITKEVIDALPQLKCIATRSTGYDHIDCVHAAAKQIQVANVPEYGSDTVAEHTFALILNLTRQIYQSVNQSKTLNFAHDAIRGVDLHSKTMGIIGLGKIGHRVLRIAHGFRMNLCAFTRSPRQDLADKYGVKYVSLQEVLTSSDVISLHLPLTPDTRHVINMSNITSLRKGSYLVNTARGGLIETAAIVYGLQNDILAGVGLDVLEEENELNEEAALLTQNAQQSTDFRTLVMNHLLINHPRVLITPHNAFNSKEALMRITTTTIENVSSFLKGQLLHPVNIKG